MLTVPIDSTTLAYMECLLWSETDDDCNPLDERFTVEDIPEGARFVLSNEVAAFRDLAGDLLDGLNNEQVGHDFCLSRNGHGAGFWDRGLGEVGDRLHDIAARFGPASLYVNDDGDLGYWVEVKP